MLLSRSAQLLRQQAPSLTGCRSSSPSLTWRSLSFYDTRFRQLAAQPVHSFGLDDLVAFALKRRLTKSLLIKSAQALQHALPIRMARRIDDMNRLPYIALMNPHMQEVYNTYAEVCEKMMDFPTVKTVSDEAHWNILLKESLDAGKRVLPALAKASKEISPHVEVDVLTNFLDTFLTSRIARRVLAEQHLALHEQLLNPANRDQHLVGVIDLDCDPTQVCRNSYEVAARVARTSYGVAPKLEVHIHGPENFKFSYISRHVEYMLLEVFKNAIRATVEHHLSQKGAAFDDSDLPPVVVNVYDHKSSTSFQVSDMGGGMSEKIESQIFDYAFSTVHTDTALSGGFNTGIMDIANRPMAGEGFGLPLTRNYADFFGGSLKLITFEGHKTDVVLKLHHVRREDYLDRLKKDILKPEEVDTEALAIADAAAKASNGETASSSRQENDGRASSLHG
eukprot:m.108289 g.108289  ORF g.108289 m.108289 type:complete len:450 (+) comp15331_c0_seq4:301-1650(+)